jgi:hypothetical protein
MKLFGDLEAIDENPRFYFGRTVNFSKKRAFLEAL